MDTNIAAWMIAGGPRIKIHAEALQREQLHAFREGQRLAAAGRVNLFDRIRAFARQTTSPSDVACCAA